MQSKTMQKMMKLIPMKQTNPLQSLQPLSPFFPLLEWQTQRGDAPGPSQAQAAEPHHLS